MIHRIKRLLGFGECRCVYCGKIISPFIYDLCGDCKTLYFQKGWITPKQRYDIVNRFSD